MTSLGGRSGVPQSARVDNTARNLLERQVALVGQSSASCGRCQVAELSVGRRHRCVFAKPLRVGGRCDREQVGFGQGAIGRRDLRTLGEMSLVRNKVHRSGSWMASERDLQAS